MGGGKRKDRRVDTAMKEDKQNSFQWGKKKIGKARDGAFGGCKNGFIYTLVSKGS